MRIHARALALLAALPLVSAISEDCRKAFARIQTHPEYVKVTQGSGTCDAPAGAPICRPGFYKFSRLRIENNSV